MTPTVRITRPKERTSVVAANYGDALSHNSLPQLGQVVNGWKLKAKYARPVDGYRKWYLVELEWTRWKYYWLPRQRLKRKMCRWIKTLASAQKAESK